MPSFVLIQQSTHLAPNNHGGGSGSVKRRMYRKGKTVAANGVTPDSKEIIIHSRCARLTTLASLLPRCSEPCTSKTHNRHDATVDRGETQTLMTPPSFPLPPRPRLGSTCPRQLALKPSTIPWPVYAYSAPWVGRRKHGETIVAIRTPSPSHSVKHVPREVGSTAPQYGCTVDRLQTRNIPKACHLWPPHQPRRNWSRSEDGSANPTNIPIVARPSLCLRNARAFTQMRALAVTLASDAISAGSFCGRAESN